MDKDIRIDYDAIKEFVEKALKEKEDEKLKEAIEDLLNKSTATIDSLTSLVDVKEETIQSLESELTEMKEELAKANDALKEKEDELSKASEELKGHQEELAELKKDLTLAERVKALEEAGVLRNGKALEIQKAKVREMSDEEFASYKEELISIRKELEEELKKSLANSDKSDKKDNKDTASLNLEGDSDDDIRDKYKKLGKALAEYIKKKED